VQARTDEGWGWILFNGIISILLGILIIAQWPVSGLYAVGIYVGIRIMMQGWAMIALGRTGQTAITHLQDTRIDDLEMLVTAGAIALKKTQLALAEHTALLVVLAREMKDKVSASDVDPAIRELNQKLGEARNELKKADEASKESWARMQKEANAIFEKLQINVSEVTKDMKNSLGLDKE
jgi:DNA anti-recombination protein RmuC